MASTDEIQDHDSGIPAQRVAKGRYKHEQEELNNAAAGTDFITGRKHEAQGSKHTVGRRTFGFVEEGKGTYNPVTGAAEKPREKVVIDKAAAVEAMVLPRAAGRGVRPKDEDEYRGPIDPITGQPVEARALPRSSSGRLVRDAVTSGQGHRDPVTGELRKPAARDAGGAGAAQGGGAGAGGDDDDGVERDPITGQPRRSQGRKSSAGAMSSFMTNDQDKGNLIG